MLVINIAKHIHNGAELPKVTVHWRLSYLTFSISRHLSMLRGVEFIDVRRKVNSLGEIMANEVVEHPRQCLDTNWQHWPNGELKNECHQIAKKESDSRNDGKHPRNPNCDGGPEQARNVQAKESGFAAKYRTKMNCA